MNIKKLINLAAILFVILLLLTPYKHASADLNSPEKLWIANLPTNEFYVMNWPAGQTVTATVDDPSTSQNPDYTLTKVTEDVADCGWRTACATFQLPEGVYLAPDWTITVTDDVITKTITLADVRVTEANVDTDIVKGTINVVIPAERLSVLFMYPDSCDPQGEYVTIDDQGNWTADFSGYCDIVPGAWGALNYHAEDGSIQIGGWGAPEAATLEGFYQPVDMNGVFNTVKNGSTIPFKFHAYLGTEELTDPADIESFTFTSIPCDPEAAVDELEVTTRDSTGLRYDPVEGQFIYNWKTPKTPGRCYTATLTAVGGATLKAYFRLR